MGGGRGARGYRVLKGTEAEVLQGGSVDKGVGGEGTADAFRSWWRGG